jgi:hypothetical protein
MRRRLVKADQVTGRFEHFTFIFRLNSQTFPCVFFYASLGVIFVYDDRMIPEYMKRSFFFPVRWVSAIVSLDLDGCLLSLYTMPRASRTTAIDR